MNRIGFLFRVKEEYINEYKEHHKTVWPDMLDALSRNGWNNYSLFMGQTGLVFGYFESKQTLGQALKEMSSEKVNSLWQELMSPYFSSPPGANSNETFVELEEVFHLE